MGIRCLGLRREMLGGGGLEVGVGEGSVLTVGVGGWLWVWMWMWREVVGFVVDVMRVLSRDDGGRLQEMLYNSIGSRGRISGSSMAFLVVMKTVGSLMRKEGRGFIDDVAGRREWNHKVSILEIVRDTCVG